MSQKRKPCLTCGSPRKPDDARCPNCGKTSREVFVDLLQTQGCFVLIILLIGLLGLLLKYLGFLPDQ
jgi:hypothetical protein